MKEGVKDHMVRLTDEAYQALKQVRNDLRFAEHQAERYTNTRMEEITFSYTILRLIAAANNS